MIAKRTINTEDDLPDSSADMHWAFEDAIQAKGKPMSLLEIKPSGVRDSLILPPDPGFLSAFDR